MNLQNLCLTLTLIKSNPHIQPEKFFKINGHWASCIPKCDKLLLDSRITGAVAVLNNVPIFIGDIFWYSSTNQYTQVILTEVAEFSLVGEGAEIEYIFRKETEKESNIVITSQYLDTFLFINKPKPKFETFLFDGVSLRKPVTARNGDHTLIVEDGKSNDYWMDSYDSINAVGNMLQTISDNILEAVSRGQSVRILTDGVTKHLIRETNT